MDGEQLTALAAKAGLVWIGYDGAPSRPVWFVWHENAVHTVVGGSEQPDPFGPAGSEFTLSVPSKDTRAVAAKARARVLDLHPGTAAWHAAAALLAGKRLNTTETDLVEVWATRSRLVRLEVLSVSAPTPADAGGGVLPVDGGTVRPRRWRPMRGHARTGSAAARSRKR